MNQETMKLLRLRIPVPQSLQGWATLTSILGSQPRAMKWEMSDGDFPFQSSPSYLPILPRAPEQCRACSHSRIVAGQAAQRPSPAHDKHDKHYINWHVKYVKFIKIPNIDSADIPYGTSCEPTGPWKKPGPGRWRVKGPM